MSEAWRTLQESYREVDRLYADLQPPVFSRQDWKASVYARRSIGEETRVEVSYLAEHFLLAWNDWWGLCGRYLRYFGQSEEKLPRTWRTLGTRCRVLADQIGRDNLLDQLVSHNWMMPAAASRLMGHDDRSAKTLFHAMVMNHRRLTVLLVLDSPLEDSHAGRKTITPDRPVLPETSDIVQRLNYALIDEWNELPGKMRENALWYLRNYQRANLAVSWLEDGAATLDDRPRSAFLYALISEKRVLPSIDEFVQHLEVDANERQTVSRVLRRLDAAIVEMGYENFVEDVTSSEFLGGPDSPVGTDAINVIPGDGPTTCCTTLLAVSQGEKKAIGFPSIMKQVRAHLIRCINKTRVVIVLCDHWKPDMLDEHVEDLRAHHERGVGFLFLMVGTPGRVIAPVAVDLGMAP